MAKILRLNNRENTCKKKKSFWTSKSAIKSAEQINGNVYECPVCYTFHVTKRKDWRDEFVPIEKYESLQEEANRLTNIVKKHKIT